ncbi:MAG: hypothetical protein OJF52_000396 [Nitrospira sp.]|nr:MAG: hypothetical protein OJF52_000396 [Nitrospira sp.]
MVDPALPGPDVPPVGRSLFDYLVTTMQGREKVYDVPFPFTALLERIEKELESVDHRSPLKRVLIPLNRSLQRNAAKPEHFTFPRAVVGVDGEPPMRAGFSGMLLKDRLFLGYQEKAAILEVISYNEAAGRFEFQVVRDYGPGQIPKVSYANRALCTTCHQNQAPIFSRPLWEETNANPNIAALLEQQRTEFYRFPLRQGIDVPNAIDDATDRANEFSVYQLLWQDGCEQAGTPRDSIQCRADVFRFLLQSRLSGSRPTLHPLSPSRHRFVQRFATYWKERWPKGLKIPNPDLLNRNPLDYVQMKSSLVGEPPVPSHGYGNNRERTMIRSIFEPSLAREPLAVWSVSHGDDGAVDRFLSGLSRFLADVDVARLDTYLFRQALRSGVHLRRYQSSCEANVRERGGTTDRVTFRCRRPEQRTDDEGPGFSMEGVLYLKAGTVVGGTIDRLSTDHEDELVDLKVAGGTLTSNGRRHRGLIDVRQKGPGLHVRLADGHAIKDISFQVGVAGKEPRLPGQTALLTGTATMAVLEDYVPIERAIDSMERATLAGESDVFTGKPFRRASTLKALFEQLKMPSLSWCCEDAHHMPDPVSTTEKALHDRDEAVRDETLPPVFKAFHRYCAQCHHEDLSFPPNFLHGSPQQIKEQVHHCAERILFRLEMWGLPPSRRQEAPMPPITELQRLNLSPEQWADHADLASMKSYSAEWLKSQGETPRLEGLAAKGYDNLRECMPPSAPAVAAASGTNRSSHPNRSDGHAVEK